MKQTHVKLSVPSLFIFPIILGLAHCPKTSTLLVLISIPSGDAYQVNSRPAKAIYKIAISPTSKPRGKIHKKDFQPTKKAMVHSERSMILEILFHVSERYSPKNQRRTGSWKYLHQKELLDEAIIQWTSRSTASEVVVWSVEKAKWKSWKKLWEMRKNVWQCKYYLI